MPKNKITSSNQGNRQTVELSNNSVSYSIYSEVQRTPNGRKVVNGVEVFSPQTTLTDIRCNPAFKITDHLDHINN